MPASIRCISYHCPLFSVFIGDVPRAAGPWCARHGYASAEIPLTSLLDLPPNKWPVKRNSQQSPRALSLTRMPLLRESWFATSGQQKSGTELPSTVSMAALVVLADPYSSGANCSGGLLTWTWRFRREAQGIFPRWPAKSKRPIDLMIGDGWWYWLLVGYNKKAPANFTAVLNTVSWRYCRRSSSFRHPTRGGYVYMSRAQWRLIKPDEAVSSCGL
jgi:hypothetical protein